MFQEGDWKSRCLKGPEASLGAKNDSTEAVLLGTSQEAGSLGRTVALGTRRQREEWEAGQRRGEPSWGAPYRGGGFGPGPVLQQHVDDVGVALLRSLVQRCVAVLGRKGGKAVSLPRSLRALGCPQAAHAPPTSWSAHTEQLRTSAPEGLSPGPQPSAWEAGGSEEASGQRSLPQEKGREKRL